MLLNSAMGTTKKGIPDAVKRAEGGRLKVIWERKKASIGIKQESFCSAMGLNQGMLQQMFSGKSAIPLETLLNLSIALDFDPREVRPSTSVTYQKMILAFAGKKDSKVLKELRGLSELGMAEIEALLNVVEASLE
jgi:transcriptional regulator with XRE-family HTH domain